MPDLTDNTQPPLPLEAAGEKPEEMTTVVGDPPADDADVDEASSEASTEASSEASSEASTEASSEASSEASTEASSEAAGGTSGGTSGGTARGIDEHAIEKWTAEQQKVFNSVKEKVQELGISKDDVQRIAAFSVLQFIAEKDRKPDTRVDRVQAVNANGDTIVRMENMKYGDREPIFTNDVRMKDAPAFDQTAAQIEQANQRLHTKSAAEQNIAMHQQNQDNNQQQRANVLQSTEDQVMARVQSSSAAIKR